MLHIEPGKELTSFARPVSGRMREGSAILVLYSVDDLSCEGYNAWIGNALFPMPESSGGNRSGPTLQEINCNEKSILRSEPTLDH